MNSLLSKLERKYSRFAIKNLMFYVVMAMAAVFILNFLNSWMNIFSLLSLNMNAVMRGEVWRLVTFLAIPPTTSILWAFFSLYFYYMLGTALENTWGSFRFTLFYLIGALCVILGALLTGYGTNEYLNLSIFFAFALLYPDYEIRLFFAIVVKMKYLAIFNVILYIIAFIGGTFATSVSLLLSLVNLALFFYPDAIRVYRKWKWKNNNRR